MNKDLELALVHLRAAQPPTTVGEYHLVFQAISIITNWMNNAVWKGARAIERETREAYSHTKISGEFGPNYGTVNRAPTPAEISEKKQHEQDMWKLQQQRLTPHT